VYPVPSPQLILSYNSGDPEGCREPQ
jgi:hypothetical protein